MYLPNLIISQQAQLLRTVSAVTIAFLIQRYFNLSHEYWLVLTAFMVTQIAAHFPLKQGLSLFFVIALGLLIAYGITTYTATFPPLIFITVIYLGLHLYFLLNPLMSARQFILCLFFFVVVLFATIVPTAPSGLIKYRLLDSAIGIAIGVLCIYLILPIKSPAAFRKGLIPHLDAAIDYITVLIESLKTNHYDVLSSLRTKELPIESQADYPEWVYEVGFNPGLRAGFRYFLIYLDRIWETLFSINYLLNQKITIPEPLSLSMQYTLENNQTLLKTLQVYFATHTLTDTPLNFTDDIDELEKSLQAQVPTGLELLDISPQYIILTELVRDIKDMRKLLLQLLMSIAPEKEGSSHAKTASN